MSNLKDALCLLAILIAYGIVGRLDYDDAVMMEEVQGARDLPPSLSCATEPVHAMPGSDAQTWHIAWDPSSDRPRCGLAPDTLATE